MRKQKQDVIVQDLLAFTVQIRRVNTNLIVGTGVVISPDGKIITCAHVVAAAFDVSWGDVTADISRYKKVDIGIYFPQAPAEKDKSQRARMSRYFRDTDDDVVLLQLRRGSPPLTSDQIAIVGTAEQSIDHPFRSYGFRPLSPFPAGRANGYIQGPVAAKQDTKVHVLPVQLTSNQLNSGMSGAPVLDLKRNLVVALVSDVWIPDGSMKDMDTAWAVDAKTLSLAPFNLPVREQALERQIAPRPNTNIRYARSAADATPGVSFNGAPALLEQWVGREDLLNALDDDWRNPDRCCTLLVGFGGQGKTSLTRRWVNNLQKSTTLSRPAGVFWWTFYNKRSVDAFFDTALIFLSGGSVDPRKLPSANVKAQVLAAMLGKGRYLFVLDGMEVTQYQQGDSYGRLVNDDLCEFLKLFAAGGHQSYCLITSRIPLFDLIKFTTCYLRSVEALRVEDGRMLLRRIGVVGSKEELDKVVTEWDGHALTLTLLGSYLVQRYKGNVKLLSRIPKPTAEEPQYERVNRVLEEYDALMTEADMDFLMLFSAFRRSVYKDAFERVFRDKSRTDTAFTSLNTLTPTDFAVLIERLIGYNILSDRQRSDYYTLHPLIRDHYYNRLKTKQLATSAHARIKDYYLNVAQKLPAHPTVDDLSPLIEAVYHACKANAFAEAYRIYQDRLDRGYAVLLYELGAYETSLALLLEFFPDEDYRQAPYLQEVAARIQLLRATGVSLMTVGRLQDALHVCNRGIEAALEGQDWFNAGKASQLRAEVHIHMGELAASKEDAVHAVDLYLHAREGWSTAEIIHSNGWGVQNLSLGPDEQTICALAYHAWVNCLLGDKEAAQHLFAHAWEILQQQCPELPYLPDLWGIYYANYLQLIGDTALARKVAKANLRYAHNNNVTEVISQSHRILGDIDALEGRQPSAAKHYMEALKIAQSITHRAALIEALTARGRWAARKGDMDMARNDLDEALGYAISCEYRILEADIHLGQAWRHQNSGNDQLAKAEALLAQKLSDQMNYYWGKQDAQEILDIM